MSQAKSAKNALIGAHRVRSGEVYSTSDLIELLQVSKKTVTFWYRLGLDYTPVSPHPSAKRFVLGDDLIMFLKCYGVALKMLSMMGEIDGEEEAEKEPEEAG